MPVPAPRALTLDGMKIESFKDEFAFLSNFFPCAVRVRGMEFRSVEHAYMACKTEDLEERRRVQACVTAGEAKRLGRTLTLRPGWDVRSGAEPLKLEVMRALIGVKFRSGSALAARLLATGDAELEEGNTWGDFFWGVCRGRGENWLGRLLMERRAALHAEGPAPAAVVVWNSKAGPVPAGFTDVFVGRPSAYGNPFRVGPALPQGEAAAAYGPHLEAELSRGGELALAIDDLAARVRGGERIALRCFCVPLPCQGPTKFRGQPSPDAVGRSNQPGGERLGQTRLLLGPAPSPQSLVDSPKGGGGRTRVGTEFPVKSPNCPVGILELNPAASGNEEHDPIRTGFSRIPDVRLGYTSAGQ